MKFVPQLSLFGRTFLLLIALITASLGVWLQAFRTMETEPQSIRIAQNILALKQSISLSLENTPRDQRDHLINELSFVDGLQIFPRYDNDIIDYSESEPVFIRVAQKLHAVSDASIVVAWKVNYAPGLWISFDVDDQPYWLKLERSSYSKTTSIEWLGWGTAALLLSLLGSAIIVGFINLPLARLAKAAQSFAKGDEFDPLPEKGAEEIRTVNASFNRMVEDLERAENDRNVMLAGISHDLRTPLARMRLEMEFLDLPEESRSGIEMDIEQLDRTINQFLEYARPLNQPNVRFNVSSFLKTLTVREKQHAENLGSELNVTIEPGLYIEAQPLDFERIVSNLIENARKYGVLDNESAHVNVMLYEKDEHIVLDVIDYGPGIHPDDIHRVLRPFELGSQARTNAKSSGLGLSIVTRLLKRMNGKLELLPNPKGGLICRISLPKISEES